MTLLYASHPLWVRGLKLPIETALYMGKDLDTGDIEIREYGKQVAGQMTINDYQDEEKEAEVLKDDVADLFNDIVPEKDDQGDDI